MRRTHFFGDLLAWLLGVFGLARPAQSQPVMGGGMMSSMGARDVISSARGRAAMMQMMGSADQGDMRVYMQMFDHHQEIHRGRSTQERRSHRNGVYESPDYVAAPSSRQQDVRARLPKAKKCAA